MIVKKNHNAGIDINGMLFDSVNVNVIEIYAEHWVIIRVSSRPKKYNLLWMNNRVSKSLRGGH